jgi:hypothetical protein
MEPVDDSLSDVYSDGLRSLQHVSPQRRELRQFRPDL